MSNVRDPSLVTFYLCIYLILNEEHFTFRLQYKHSGTFANRKYEELPCPKNQKMCDPILVSLLKMPPHYSQSSHENATPSSGTCPLASHKEVPPPPVVMIVAFGIRNTAQGIRNPTSDWNPDPSSTNKESAVPGIWNPRRGIQDHRGSLGLPNMGRIVSCRDKFIRFCNTSYIPWVSSKNCSFIDRMMLNGYRKQRARLVLCTI